MAFKKQSYIKFIQELNSKSLKGHTNLNLTFTVNKTTLVLHVNLQLFTCPCSIEVRLL